MTDTVGWGPKNIFTPTTLCGNWSEDRWDKEFQEKQRYAKVYALPGRGSTGWTKTSDAIGENMKEEMIKKVTVVREIDVLKYAQLPPEEMYSTHNRRDFNDPNDRYVPPERAREDAFDPEWLAEYRKTWTHADGWLYTRKEHFKGRA
ncbi:unnamed protein product [Amoebophrya sp. A120]|nr:unnamed protein product [Amoebophrya sp. A120]|eukprot:GSA120T00025676001.1